MKMLANGIFPGCLLAALLAPAAASAANISVNTRGDREIENCQQIQIEFDDRDAERSEDTFTLAGGPPLGVHLPSHSGIQVLGWSRKEISVTSCKAARSSETLDRISVSADAGRLLVRGPGGDEWLVYLILRVPRGAELDLEARNGPIGLSGVSGKLRARTSNGPISFRDSSGQIEAHAENGPISLKDCSGEVRAEAINGPIHVSGNQGNFRVSTQNGPISVALTGDRWTEGGLEASAVNGPLSLKIPEDYRSGVRVEARGHSPVSCPASACKRARKTWDDDERLIEFGDSDPVVRMSTVNGPVSIKARD